MLADSMFSNNLYFYLFYLTTWFISLSIPYKFIFIDSFFVATMSILGLIKYYLYVWNVWILCSRSVHIEKLYHIYIFLIEYCKKNFSVLLSVILHFVHYYSLNLLFMCCTGINLDFRRVHDIYRSFINIYVRSFNNYCLHKLYTCI